MYFQTKHWFWHVVLWLHQTVRQWRWHRARTIDLSSELRVPVTRLCFLVSSTPWEWLSHNFWIALQSSEYLNTCNIHVLLTYSERVNTSQCMFGNINMIWLWSESLSRLDGNATRGFICAGEQHSCVWSHRTSFVSPRPHLNASFTGQRLITTEQCLHYANTGSLNLEFDYLPIVRYDTRCGFRLRVQSRVWRLSQFSDKLYPLAILVPNNNSMKNRKRFQ